MYLDILFYLFSTLLVLFSIGVIAFKNPMNALLSLVMCFFNAAGLFILLGAEFLAFLLIMVYVGAVVVMFIFVIMTVDMDKVKYKNLGKKPIIALSIVISELITLIIFKSDELKMAKENTLAAIAQNYDKVDNTVAIGDRMFTTFAYPFILISFILLVAMLAAIVMTFTKQKHRKQQNISEQNARKREDSVEVVKVESGSGVNF